MHCSTIAGVNGIVGTVAAKRKRGEYDRSRLTNDDHHIFTKPPDGETVLCVSICAQEVLCQHKYGRLVQRCTHCQYLPCGSRAYAQCGTSNEPKHLKPVTIRVDGILRPYLAAWKTCTVEQVTISCQKANGHRANFAAF